MGTSSTVKFFDEGVCILSLYQQYDGYIGGVGKQLATILEERELVNGFSEEASNIANGIGDLALLYVTRYKDGVGNMYATSEDDSQEYDYVVNSKWIDEKDEIELVTIFKYGNEVFKGTKEEFIHFVSEL